LRPFPRRLAPLSHALDVVDEVDGPEESVGYELLVEDNLVLRAELPAGLSRHLVDARDARLDMQREPERRRLAVQEPVPKLRPEAVERVAAANVVEARHVSDR
jgi:hypothetical protein